MPYGLPAGGEDAGEPEAGRRMRRRLMAHRSWPGVAKAVSAAIHGSSSRWHTSACAAAASHPLGGAAR